MEVFISFLRINTFLLFFRNMFFTMSQALGNVQSASVLWKLGVLCVLCLGWLS
jgi:hypothetical protein